MLVLGVWRGNVDEGVGVTERSVVVASVSAGAQRASGRALRRERRMEGGGKRMAVVLRVGCPLRGFEALNLGREVWGFERGVAFLRLEVQSWAFKCQNCNSSLTATVIARKL
jgi:hypothetical protein